MTRHFTRNSAGKSTYTCVSCKKVTRETGEGESGCEMCRECYLVAGTQNTHADNHDGRFADCADCTHDLKVYGIKMSPADAWCDHAPEEAAK